MTTETHSAYVASLSAATTLAGTESVAGIQGGLPVEIAMSQIGTYAKGLLSGTSPLAYNSGTGVISLNAGLTSFGGLSVIADRFAYGTGTDTWALGTITTFGRSFIDDANATAGRTTLGVVIGADVQAFDTDLTAIAALTSAADKTIYATGVGTWSTTDLTAGGRALIATAGTANTFPYFSALNTLTLGAVGAGGLAVLAGANVAAIKTTLGLTIGTDVLAYDAGLSNLGAVTTAANKGYYTTGVDTFASYDLSAGGRALANVAGTANTFPYFSSSNVITLGTVGATGLSVLAGASVAAIKTTLSLTIGTDVQAYDADLAAIAGLTSAADALPYFTGSGTAGVTTMTSFARTLLDDTTSTIARATLGVVIGTDVQAFNANLTALAGLTLAANKIPYATGAGAMALETFTPGAGSTWSPTVTLGTPAGSGFVATVNQAIYFKIGRLVYISCVVTLTNLGTGPVGSGLVNITLPFNAAGTSTFDGTENAVTAKALQGNCSGGSNILSIKAYDGSTASTTVTGAQIRIGGCYLADS